MRKNKHKKIGKVSCRLNCIYWMLISRKNGIVTVCTITNKDLPNQGKTSVPYWCPLIKDYYEKKRSKKK